MHKPAALSISLMMLLTTSCDMSLDPDEPWQDELPQMSEHLGIYVSNKKERFWIAILADGTYRLCNAKRCDQGAYWGSNPKFLQLGGFYSLPVGTEISRWKYDFVTNEALLKKWIQEDLAERAKTANGFGYTAGFATRDCTEDRHYCIGFGSKEQGVWFRRVYRFPKANDEDMPPGRPDSVEIYDATGRQSP